MRTIMKARVFRRKAVLFVEGFKLIFRYAISGLVFLLCIPSEGLSVEDSVSELREDNCRFYASTSADLDGDGMYEIIAVGQINRGGEDNHSGLIVLVRPQGSILNPYADLSFDVHFNGQKLPTRIRSVRVLRNEAESNWNLFVAGRGGGDDSGVGFLYHAVISNDEIQLKGEKIFTHSGSTETHGYPLTAADLDGDGSQEIIYGGFYGTNQGDRADVRAFTINGGELLEHSRPFENLKIPLRVNALDAGDLDGDGHPDIAIAGRTQESEDREFSAIAWWSNGTVSHLVFDNDNPSRLRTILISDLDGDGRTELISGGRLELGDLWLADLRRWSLEQDQMVLKDQFFWSLGDKMRLRTLSVVKDKENHIKVGGRAERVMSDGESRWTGFVWEFSVDQNRLKPVGSSVYFDSGFDTRVRHIHLTDTGVFVATGFTKAMGEEKTDSGFVWLIK